LQMKPTNDVGSVILAKMPAKLPGMNGLLTILMDQTNQLYVYGEHLTINGNEGKLLPWKLREPLKLVDAQKNQATISVEEVFAGVVLVEMAQQPQEQIAEQPPEGA